MTLTIGFAHFFTAVVCGYVAFAMADGLRGRRLDPGIVLSWLMAAIAGGVALWQGVAFIEGVA